MTALKKYDSLAVFSIALLVCTSFIGLYPIYILDEARNSEAAREMLVSGNYIVPFFNGELRTDKPPLHYFFMTLGYQLFGVNAFGARFFSGVFGALTFLITYRNVKRWQNASIAWITVTILASSLFFVQEFHLAVPDPYLIFFVTLSLFSFYNLYKTRQWQWIIVFYSAIAFGLLSKGPIALALPGLVIPIFLAFKKEFNLSTILRLRPFLGLLLILLIAAPWYYQVHLATEGIWTEGFFLDHNISRFGAEKEGHGGLFIITPLYVILGLLPFSVFAIQAFRKVWEVRKEHDFVWFSWIIAIVTIVFFSISGTKLPNYPMPCYPFVAIVIAFYLHEIYRSNTKPGTVIWSLVFLLIISVALPVAGYVALGLEEQLSEVRYVSLVLLLTSFSGFLAYRYYKKEQHKKAFTSIVAGWILTELCLFGIAYPVLTTQSPVTLALKTIPKTADIVAFKKFDSAFPINFQRTFPVFTSIDSLQSYLERNPEAYVITNTKSKTALKQLEHLTLLLEQKAPFENHTTRIYTVH